MPENKKFEQSFLASLTVFELTVDTSPEIL